MWRTADARRNKLYSTSSTRGLPETDCCCLGGGAAREMLLLEEAAIKLAEGWQLVLEEDDLELLM